MDTVADLHEVALKGRLGAALAAYLDCVDGAPVGCGAEKRSFAELQSARDEVFFSAERYADAVWAGADCSADGEIVLICADAEDAAWGKLIAAVGEAQRRRSRYRPHTRERLAVALHGYAQAWMQLSQSIADAAER